MQVNNEHISYLYKKHYTSFGLPIGICEYSPSILGVLSVLLDRCKIGGFSVRLTGIVQRGEVNCCVGFIYSKGKCSIMLIKIILENNLFQ
jgi:hypothetical protein